MQRYSLKSAKWKVHDENSKKNKRQASRCLIPVDSHGCIYFSHNYVWYVWSIAKQKSSPKLQGIYWGQSCKLQHAALCDWGWLLTCQHSRAKIGVHSKSQFSIRHTTMITSGTRFKGSDLISQEPANRQFWRQSVQVLSYSGVLS